MALSKVNPNFVGQNLGRRNLIINGDAQINQKGNQSGVGDAGYIGPDRWLSFINTSSTLTFSQETQTIGHTDNNPDSKYNFKFDWLGTGAITIKTIAQRIEGVHHGNGRKMTLSFWGKTEQADDGIIRIIQSFGSGGSPSAGVVIDSSSIDFQNSWTYHTYTWDMPSTSGKTLGTDNNDHIEVQFRFTGTLNSYFQFTDVQVEVGDIATPYERRSFAEEISLCHRYFRVVGPYGNPRATGGNDFFLVNVMHNNENRLCAPYFDTPFRSAPSVTLINHSNGGTGALTEFSSGTVRSQTAFSEIGLHGGGYPQFNGNFGNPARWRAEYNAEL